MSTQTDSSLDVKTDTQSDVKQSEASRRYITKRRETPNSEPVHDSQPTVGEATEKRGNSGTKIQSRSGGPTSSHIQTKRPSGSHVEIQKRSSGAETTKRPANQTVATKRKSRGSRSNEVNSGQANKIERQSRGSKRKSNQHQQNTDNNADETNVEEQKRQSVAKLLAPEPPRQRWSSNAQLGNLDSVGERTTPVDSDVDTEDVAPLPGGPEGGVPLRIVAGRLSAPAAPVRSLVTPIYAPERIGIPQVPYKGVPVVYVPVPVAPMPPNATAPQDSRSEEALRGAPPIRLQCKFWKQGNCKFGESCAFSHSDDSLVILPPIPQVVGSNQSNSQKPTTPEKKWHGVGSLPKEQVLAALRLLSHIEEVQANHMEAIIPTDGGGTSITELYYRLESREVDPPVPVVVILNDLLNSEEFLSITESASRLVPHLPEATLDLGAILNTSRLVDNDALLFFCYLLKDVQEHFYHEFKNKYLLTTPDGTYNTDAVGKVLEQIGVSEQEIMSKFNFSEAKTSIQGCKRWKSLFILNDPTLITFVEKVNTATAEDLKWQILRRLDDHIRSAIKTKEAGSPPISPTRVSAVVDANANASSASSAPTESKLPAFEVRTFDEPRGQSARKKLWNEYTGSLTPIEIYRDLCTHVAELVVPGLTNFPAIFAVLSEKLKMRRFADGEKNLDTKLAAISKMLTTWPEVLLLPEVLQRTDGKLHVYRSVTAQHQFGSVYVEMMTRLKKKYLYKSSLEKLS